LLSCVSQDSTPAGKKRTIVEICFPFDGFVQTYPYVLSGDLIRWGPVNSFGFNPRRAHSPRKSCLASSRARASVLVVKITISCTAKARTMANSAPPTHSNIRQIRFTSSSRNPHRSPAKRGHFLISPSATARLPSKSVNFLPTDNHSCGAPGTRNFTWPT
jgi:hypothetical protein